MAVFFNTTVAVEALFLLMKHCSFEVSCPDNGTAPGCIQLPQVPISKRSFSIWSVIAALVAMAVSVCLFKTQLTADLCRLCLGAGNPLGM